MISVRFIRRTSLFCAPLCASILAVSTLGSPILTGRAWSQEVPVKTPAPAPILLDELPKLIGEPTTVTFTGTNVPVKKITQVLLNAAGLTPSASAAGIGDAEDATIQSLSLNWQALPFWEAAQQVEDATGAFWCSVGSNGLTLQRPVKPGEHLPGNIVMPDIPGVSFGDFTNAGDLNGRVAFENPYLKLLVTSISSGRQASLNTMAEEDAAPAWNASLTLAAYPDPKLKIDSMQVSDVMVDAQGVRMNASTKEVPVIDLGLMAAGGGKGLFSTKKVNLSGTGTDTVLSKISGMVHLNIVVATENWKVADLLESPNNTHVANGISLKIGNAQLQNGELHLQVTATTADAIHDLSGLNLSDNSLKIYDGKGRQLQQDTSLNQPASFSGTFQTNPGGGSEFSKELVFKSENGSPIEGPIAIEWNLPKDIRPLDVPFELHDVKMP